MKSNKKFWLLFAVLIAIISLVILSLSALYTAAKAIRTSGKSEMPEVENHEEINNTQKSSVYIMREHRGIIGIFSESGDLLEIIETPIVSLPKKDREKLLIGININGERELSSLREDYS